MIPNVSRPSFEGDPPAAAEDAVIPDRRELALVAIERTRMPMVVTDPRQPNNPIVMANGAFLELTGYTAGEVIGGNCRFLQGADTDPESVAKISAGLHSGADHVDVEMLNYRKDGSSFWNQLSISAVRDEAGELLYYFGSQKDVTARRRAEELEATQRLLLMEVDHRALNALALVQSIVRLTRADDVTRFASSIIGRVDALATAHRLLAKSAWSGSDLMQLVAAETPRSVASRVHASGPPLQLPARIVQPFALVLHELMSNARTHGALAGRGGRVELTWKEQPEGIVLHWKESGLHGTEEPAEQGFGLAILDSVIEKQLGGRIEREWPDDGFSCRMTVPVATAR